MARSGFRITSDTLTPGLRKFPDKLHDAIGKLVDYEAIRAQGYMRENAPWTDRTGNARAGLFATPEHFEGGHAIDLYHSVPYGIWLEVRFEGRFAIILPTIEAKGPELMEAARSLLGRMS